jgi:hypothetical protein
MNKQELLCPKEHPLKNELKSQKLAIYRVKVFLGKGYPSETQLWKMLNGFVEMPDDVAKRIRSLLNR